MASIAGSEQTIIVGWGPTEHAPKLYDKDSEGWPSWSLNIA